MAKFLLRRLANYVILVAVATTGAYALASVSLKPRANFEGRNPPPPEKVVDQQLTELNLNDKTPVLTRYKTWVSGLAHGSFGKTWDGTSVNAELGRRIGVSLRLLLIATIIGGLLGVLAGAWGAIRQYQLSDHAVTMLSFVILSVPVFVLAVVLEIAAVGINNAVGSKVFEYTGEFTPGLQGGFWVHALDRLKHLVLPSLTLVLGEIAIFSRYQRSAMLDVLGQDFVRTAQAKGLRRRTALLKHALRTALIPAVTYFTFNFGILIVGATFTEKIFGWHGMGEWLVDSVTRQDTNAVAAVTCFAAIMILLAGLASDIAYAILDPRIRVS
ncbi:MAG: glutathione transport system permease protein [Solirubrobacteraceae bacterium]|jgi:peptide/nickel transport system permease protein|nr:glutathione transport system permease protein [Solirubrobacteraceae bacterium]